MAIVACGLLALGFLVFWLSTLKTPNLDSLNNRVVSQSTKIYDRTGSILLYDVHQDAKRSIVPGNEISVNIKNAAVAIEDNEFYTHSGVKISAIFRALLSNLSSGCLTCSQGGSTITQQVVKNSLLTNERAISRKLKEWVLAWKLEKTLDKDSILSIYLNESPFGGTIYGVEEASQAFFNKHASDVTVAEGAYLASLLKAPTYYSPFGSHRQALEDRHNLVLQKERENKFITEEEYKRARNETITFNSLEKTGIKAPHFVNYVIEKLQEKYGNRAIIEGGYKVITTLDYDLEAKAEEIAKKFALENEKKFNASNAAIIALDATNGQILTMVGSRDYFDKAIDGNFNVTTALRQPGSAFKPIVYATAINKGYTPETVVFDVPTEFSSECNPDGTPIRSTSKCYSPKNYDGNFSGPVTLRVALGRSLNIPAIKTLYLAGLPASLQMAKDMGITSLTEDAGHYGLTLVLGGGEVSPLELTSAYSVFANEGTRNPYASILEITDPKGKVLEKFEQNSAEVMPKKTALTISQILSDDSARVGTFIPHSLLWFSNRDVAVKTGTTNNYRDAWVVGYTPQIAVGAWAGNNDNSPMDPKVAGTIVVPMWNAFMQDVLRKYPDVKFHKPEQEDISTLQPVLRGFWQGGQSYFIDKTTGKLATDYTPVELREERFLNNVHSILYWIDKDTPRGAKPTNPSDDPQFSHWEYGVLKWAQDKKILPGGTIPTGTDDIHLPEYIPKVSILFPTTGALYQRDTRMTVNISSLSHFVLSKVDYFLNDTYIGSGASNPWSFSFVPSQIDGLGEENELKAVATDLFGNKGEAKIVFKVN